MVLPLLWDSECAVKISREKITCCKLLSRAGIGAQSPQAQPPFQWLLDCEEQPTREQEVGSRMEEPWWRFPQSFVKQLRCERWSKRFGWVKGWLVVLSTSPPWFSASPWGPCLSSLLCFHCSLACPAGDVRGNECWSSWLHCWKQYTFRIPKISFSGLSSQQPHVPRAALQTVGRIRCKSGSDQ